MIKHINERWCSTHLFFSPQCILYLWAISLNPEMRQLLPVSPRPDRCPDVPSSPLPYFTCQTADQKHKRKKKKHKYVIKTNKCKGIHPQCWLYYEKWVEKLAWKEYTHSMISKINLHKEETRECWLEIRNELQGWNHCHGVYDSSGDKRSRNNQHNFTS